MTRPLRIEVPNGIHHVMSRGVERRDVFETDQDRHLFLLTLRACLRRHRWRCVAYCLMGNHYHLLIQTPRANLAPGMRDLNGDYATAFNAQRRRIGPLFTHRYRSQLIQDDAYLLAVARYIALNPIRAGLVGRPEDWPWGSYAELVAGTESKLVDARPLLSIISDDPVAGREAFVALVADGSGLPGYRRLAPIVGDPEFVARHAPSEPPQRPVTRTAWQIARPPLASLFGRLPEEEFIRQARVAHRYTVREIAEALGLSEATIGRRLKALELSGPGPDER